MPVTASASVDLAGEPAAGGVGEDGAADREALDQVMAGGGGEACLQRVLRRLEAEHDDAAAVRVVGGDRGAGGGPCGVGGHRLELPPVGTDAEVVDALDDPGRGGVVDRRDLGGDDLEQQFQPVGAGGAGEADEGRLLVGLHRGVVVGVGEGEHLDHLLDRPLGQRAAVVGLDLQPERAGARLLDRAADPEAGAGGGVERVAAEAAVAEDAVAGAAVGDLARGLEAQELEGADAVVGLAEVVGEGFELRAVVEGEDASSGQSCRRLVAQWICSSSASWRRAGVRTPRSRKKASSCHDG